MRFSTLIFSSFEPARATDQWVEVFSILIKISPIYLNFYVAISPGYPTAQSQSPRGMIPRGVSAKSFQLGPPTTTHALLVYIS